MRQVAEGLNARGIRYYVTGSMAAMAYSEWRTTFDVDIVVSIGRRDIPQMMELFSGDDFFIQEHAVRDAVENLRQFNVIHTASKFKLDFIVVDEDGFAASCFSRRREIIFEKVPIWISSPEDVILSKLRFYKIGRSEKHLRDIASIFKVSGAQIDRAYAEHWAMRTGVSELWNYVLARAEGREPGPTV